jgi:hypothetical protein
MVEVYRGKTMKKIVCIYTIILMLMNISVINIVAMDEDDIEITDEIDDVFIPKETLFQLLQTLGIISLNTLQLIDIEYVNIYEEQSEPDYLFASMKINNLEYDTLRAFYAISWVHNDIKYHAGCHTHSNGQFTWFSAGRSFGLFDNWAYKAGLQKDIEDCTIDDESDMIHFKIPKSLIGNPQKGDILTYATARTGLRFIFEPISYLLFPGEIALDTTSQGTEYIIRY